MTCLRWHTARCVFWPGFCFFFQFFCASLQICAVYVVSGGKRVVLGACMFRYGSPSNNFPIIFQESSKKKFCPCVFLGGCPTCSEARTSRAQLFESPHHTHVNNNGPVTLSSYIIPTTSYVLRFNFCVYASLAGCVYICVLHIYHFLYFWRVVFVCVLFVFFCRHTPGFTVYRPGLSSAGGLSKLENRAWLFSLSQQGSSLRFFFISSAYGWDVSLWRVCTECKRGFCLFGCYRWNWEANVCCGVMGMLLLLSAGRLLLSASGGEGEFACR